MTRWAVVLVALMAGVPAVAAGQGTDQRRPIRDVLVADVNGDLAGFLDRIKRIEGVNRRLGLGAELRVFQATFAGRQTGEVYVYWELPSFHRFAEAETRLHDDPEYRAILAEMVAAGQRFTSELLTVEITPR
jgi:hypothetical protein